MLATFVTTTSARVVDPRSDSSGTPPRPDPSVLLGLRKIRRRQLRTGLDRTADPPESGRRERRDLLPDKCVHDEREGHWNAVLRGASRSPAACRGRTRLTGSRPNGLGDAAARVRREEQDATARRAPSDLASCEAGGLVGAESP